MRDKNREANQIREASIKPHVNKWAEGSAEISMGETKLLCAASVSDTTPKWLNRPDYGWVTAEYAMLPRAGDRRTGRERAFSGGRSQEISRLIGRSLRAAVDLQNLGERQIYIDCDVLQADGGTRTAGVTGGFVALSLALKHLHDKTLIKSIPLKFYVAAVSVGLLKGKLYLDLDSKEDKSCAADMNFVMTSQGDFIEIQGTAEKKPFSREQLLEMMELAKTGCARLFAEQQRLIGGFFPLPPGSAQ